MRVRGIVIFDGVKIEEAGAGDAGFAEDLLTRALLGIVGEEPGGAEGDGAGRCGDCGGDVFGEGEGEFGGGDEVGGEEGDGGRERPFTKIPPPHLGRLGTYIILLAFQCSQLNTFRL